MKMNKRIKKKHQLEDDIAFLAIHKNDSLKLFFIPFEGKRWRRLRKLKYKEVYDYAKGND